MQYGILSPEEARTHPRRHMVTRPRAELIVGIDVLSLDVTPATCFSSAATAFTGPRGAGGRGAARAHPPEAACRALVRRAREEGGEDNLSAQIACVLACPPAHCASVVAVRSLTGVRLPA